MAASFTFGGVDTHDAREKLRGDHYVIVAIDEAGSIDADNLKYVVEDVLNASLFDYDGQLILCGTPHATASGYFYDADNSDKWSHHHWNIQLNPKLPRWSKFKDWEKRAAEFIEEQRNELPENKFKRETLGIWARDEQSLVFMISKTRNTFKGDLPKDESYSYVLGIDTRME